MNGDHGGAPGHIYKIKLEADRLKTTKKERIKMIHDQTRIEK